MVYGWASNATALIFSIYCGKAPLPIDEAAAEEVPGIS